MSGNPSHGLQIFSWFQSHGTGRQIASASSLLTLAENSGTTVSPATKVKVFGPWRNQLNRGRTLVGVAIRSSSFVAIKYANELPNRTATQFGVLLDLASTTPSSWVAARRILSPILMLMPLSFSSSRALDAMAWQQ
jgi:hypothetical protein